MQDSRFWRMLAALAVLATFYVGHGLHSRTTPELNPLATRSARADGVAIHAQGMRVYTTNSDGTKLYLWSFTPHSVKFVASAEAEPAMELGRPAEQQK